MIQETVRVNMNVPSHLVEQVDVYAGKMHVNRTSAICVLLSQALNYEKSLDNLDELLKLVKEKDKMN